MKRSPLVLLAAGVVAVAAAGCGATTTLSSNNTLQIAVSEYRITPQAVRAGVGTLTIVVHNDGRLSHNLVISRGGVVEASTTPIAPGQWTELVAALQPGRYLMASSLLSDQALGAYGTLDVGGH
jgi:Cupredoxin-like domain